MKIPTTFSNSLSLFRNYLIVATITVFVTIGLTSLFMAPSRIGQQATLNHGQKVISAGIVASFTNFGR